MLFVEAPAVGLVGEQGFKGMGAIVDVATSKILKARIPEVEEQGFLQG